jgi:hypothetical protein
LRRGDEQMSGPGSHCIQPFKVFPLYCLLGLSRHLLPIYFNLAGFRNRDRLLCSPRAGDNFRNRYAHGVREFLELHKKVVQRVNGARWKLALHLHAACGPELNVRCPPPRCAGQIRSNDDSEMMAASALYQFIRPASVPFTPPNSSSATVSRPRSPGSAMFSSFSASTTNRLRVGSVLIKLRHHILLFFGWSHQAT